MGGFKQSSLNNIFKDRLFIKIREYLIKSCEAMVEDSLNNGMPLVNHEDKIKNRLVFTYLRDSKNRTRLGFEELKLSFDAENSENYSSSDDIANAKLDIKVTSEDTLSSNDRYYTIECKRLDGNKRLNDKYVTEGVSRFVSNPVKYASSYGKNFMLGFVVKETDIVSNADKINEAQLINLPAEILMPLQPFTLNLPSFCIYYGTYKTLAGNLELNHIFFNVSNAIN